MGNDFNPYSKEKQLGGAKKEKVRKGLQARTPLQQKIPMKQKRDTPRKKDKTKTQNASGYKKPTRYERGYFGKDYEVMFEQHGDVCGERLVPSHDENVPACSGGLEAHHVKFKSGGGRGVWRNGRPLCEAHHKFAHTKFWYAEKWRMIHEEKYGEYYFMDEWDAYKEKLIDEPTKETFEEFMKENQKKTNWGI